MLNSNNNNNFQHRYEQYNVRFRILQYLARYPLRIFKIDFKILFIFLQYAKKLGISNK